MQKCRLACFLLLLAFYFQANGSTVHSYISNITNLKVLLLKTQKQFNSNHRNVAILELLLNKIFNISYQLLISENYATKYNALTSGLHMLDIGTYTEKNSWNFNNFNSKATHAATLLNNIKTDFTANHHINNTAIIELLLQILFGEKYIDLISTNLITKQIDLEMSFKRLSWLASVKDSPYLTGLLTLPEILDLHAMQLDTDHFTELKLVPGQRQKGATCGSHAILNAWAIEQLLAAELPITAHNIFTITAPILAKPDYAIDSFIFPDEVCMRIPHFIETKMAQTGFKHRLNFLAYHNLGVAVGVHYTEKPAAANWFLNLGQIPLMKEQLEKMMSISPHVQHFIYNTGAHWVLASIVQKPHSSTKLYFIDSAESAVDADEVRSRFVLSLYENFVKSK